MVFKHVRMVMLEIIFCVFRFVVVGDMYTFKTGSFRNKPLCVVFVLLYRVCTNLRLGILATSLCVYVYVVAEGIYTCKYGNFGQQAFVLCLCFCRGHANI